MAEEIQIYKKDDILAKRGNIKILKKAPDDAACYRCGAEIEPGTPYGCSTAAQSKGGTLTLCFDCANVVY